MTINPTQTVERLIQQQMARGTYSSENDVLEEALRTLSEKQEREETIQAVRAGVAAAEAGETSSVDEVFDRLDREFPDLKSEP